MEIGGAAYLYGLAATAMAFIGFSAIVIIIRQTLTEFQLLLMLLAQKGARGVRGIPEPEPLSTDRHKFSFPKN